MKTYLAKQITTVIMIGALVNLSTGCAIYKSSMISNTNPIRFENYKMVRLYHNDAVWDLRKPHIEGEFLVTIPIRVYLKTVPIRPVNKATYIEISLSPATELVAAVDVPLRIPLSSIEKINVFDIDKVETIVANLLLVSVIPIIFLIVNWGFFMAF